MSEYKRLTNNNLEDYDPEYDFCISCKYFGEPNGCNRPNGTCDSYDRFMETYNRLVELEDKIEDGTLIELHKDIVVLSREEYEAYKKLAEAIYEEGAFNHYDDVINSAKIMFEDRKKLVKDTSKETAEKFAKGLIKIIKEKDTYLDWDDILEFAKQFGVEIKE